jgi:hypothetical protein
MQSHRSREIWCKKRSSLLSLLTESNFEESLIHHDDARSGNPLTLTGLDPRFGNGRLLHTTGAAEPFILCLSLKTNRAPTCCRKQYTKLGASSPQPRHHCSNRTVQDICNLQIGEFLIFPQEDNLAKIYW